MKGAGVRRFRSAAPAAALLLTGIFGCFNPFAPPRLTGGISTPPPVPNSPGNVLRLLEWCYDNRAIAEYREVFTDDYRFAFSTLDPLGNAYRDVPWTREDELASTQNLFHGGDANQPAAGSISLHLDRNFLIGFDPRPGRDPRRHRTVRTSVLLDVQYASGNADKVTGFANFFLVRGDLALLPAELKARGFGPDSTRWYIERWEDDTAQLPPPGGTPAGLEAATPWASRGRLGTASQPGAEGSPESPESPASENHRPGADPAGWILNVSWGGLKRAFR